MAPSNDGVPTERTSLLSKSSKSNSNNNGKAIDSYSSDEITASESYNSIGDENGSILKGGDENVVDEETGEIEEEDDNPLFEGNPDVNMRLLFPAVALGILLSAADQTIIVSSYGKIGSDLQALNNTSWIATAYFLTLTSFQPLYGKLSDIFGRKSCLLFSYTVFGLGCLFCGLARNLNELVAARAFAGIGGGGMATVVSILFSDIIPLRERGTWQGYMNIVYATGASLGAPLGGLLSDSIGWRWAFIIQFPLTFLASLIVHLVLHLPPPSTTTPTTTHTLTKLRQIDFLGALTLILAISSLLIGLDLGSNTSWTSNLTLSFLLTSLPLFTIFIYIEIAVATHPFAPGHVILSPSLFASYLCNFFTLSAYMGTIFYIPLYLQAVDGMSATSAGMRFIPVMACSVSGSLFGGKVMQRTGKYSWLTIACLGLSVVGGVVIFMCSGLVVSSSWGIVVGLGMSAFGGGAAITTTLISVIANADPKDQAIATACTYLFRSLGSVVGVSLAATVVQQSLRTRLRAGLESGREADEIVEKVRQSLDFIKGLDPGVRRIVRACYQGATNATFGMGIGIICLALVSACFIREKKLSK
ncbi:major facilitator superfamily domain-containing protein [Leptodontidium sp. MPI-SDFR-AT-0119]|nr:major facilitator superfamily domain-containing protein [Leptodontidium sp. MPI-SDFR-AT-0119]